MKESATDTSFKMTHNDGTDESEEKGEIPATLGVKHSGNKG